MYQIKLNGKFLEVTFTTYDLAHRFIEGLNLHGRSIELYRNGQFVEDV